MSPSRGNPITPTPDSELPAAEYVSTNGAHAKAWSDNIYRLVVLAYIAAATMPPIGVILAFVVLGRAGRSYSKHVVWIIVVAVVAAGIWTGILASGALNVTSNDY